jgi:Zn-dependent protease/predicted transcriptional regulator
MAQSQGFRIGKVIGIPIYIDFSWIIIFSLITYGLSAQFNQSHPQWTTLQYWAVAILTSILFFGSVLFHELSHSLVAQYYKLKVVSITLFIFGGVARIAREPSKPLQEFNIAIAGPIASALLSALFFFMTLAFAHNPMVVALAMYLCVTNGLLAAFNLLPGFPLDGGRIFRAIVWGATKNFSKATIVAGASGKLIAYGMIAYGLYRALNPENHDWQGIWYVLIGWFLLNAAHASVQQVTIRETLTGLTAADVMSNEVPTIPGNMSLEEYSREVLRTGRRVHIVTSDDRLVGLMNVTALNSIPRDEWNMNSVQATMVPRDKILWASPEEPLQRLLERLMSSDVNQMPVVHHGEDGSANIVGMVTRDAILRVIQTRSELGAATAAR